MGDDPYPEVSSDVTGLDRLVLLLSDIDGDEYTHFDKFIGLVGCARREWDLARQHDEVPERLHDLPFGRAAQVTEAELEEVIGRVEDD